MSLMDSRLKRLANTRLTYLLRSDAPRVAQAIVDAVNGRARVLTGLAQDTSFIEFVKAQSYDIIVRGDDWQKIFPFLRYSTSTYTPVIPPATEPPPILSNQPNRVVPTPPVIPDKGLRSFLNFPFDVYSKIQRLLPLLSINNFDKVAPRVSYPFPEPPSLVPPVQRKDYLSFSDTILYNKLVFILEQLFPLDFPVAPENLVSPNIFVLAGEDMVQAGDVQVTL